MSGFDPGTTVELVNNGENDTHDLRVYAPVGTRGTVVQRYSWDALPEDDARYIVLFDDAHPSGEPLRQHVAGNQLLAV